MEVLKSGQQKTFKRGWLEDLCGEMLKKKHPLTTTVQTDDMKIRINRAVNGGWDLQIFITRKEK